MKFYRQLAEQNPDGYLPYLAITLNDMANLDGTQNRNEEARQYYEESSTIYRKLAQQDPEKYLPYLARTLYNLGFLDRSQQRIAEARAHYDEALGVFRKLWESDDRYAEDVARVEASLDQLGKATSPKRLSTRAVEQRLERDAASLALRSIDITGRNTWTSRRAHSGRYGT